MKMTKKLFFGILVISGFYIYATMTFDEERLIRAAAGGDLATVNMLLEKGVNVNAQDDYGMTPLMWAAQRGKEAVVGRLLEVEGIDLSHQESIDRNTALAFAIIFKHAPIVKRLLDAGADPDGQGGPTPLLKAIAINKPSIVRMLLNAGADPNTESALLGTPLIQAVLEGNISIVNDLLEAGANPSHQFDGGTAYEWAMEVLNEDPDNPDRVAIADMLAPAEQTAVEEVPRLFPARPGLERRRSRRTE